MRMTAEPHELPEADFLSEVHSFDFWFQAVEGYLLDTEHGRDAALTDAPMEEVQRENLISTLCNYCVGETAALEASNTDVFLNAVLKLLHALGVKLSASPIYS